MHSIYYEVSGLINYLLNKGLLIFLQAPLGWPLGAQVLRAARALWGWARVPPSSDPQAGKLSGSVHPAGNRVLMNDSKCVCRSCWVTQ